jgi:hypothetical protein
VKWESALPFVNHSVASSPCFLYVLQAWRDGQLSPAPLTDSARSSLALASRQSTAEAAREMMDSVSYIRCVDELCCCLS